MRKARLFSCLVVLVAGVPVTLAADMEPAATGLRLPRIFSDHMVLQRDKPVRIWGWAAKGETVTVGFAGQNKSAKAAADGAWLVTLDPMPVSSQGRTLLVTSESGSGQSEIKDVLVGDVWIGSGQSNMELDLEGTSRLMNKLDECYFADHPAIRLMQVPAETSGTPQDDIPGASWTICTPGAAGPFSAVAYYFARDVHEATKVPIGMIQAARGGTYPESWQTRESLESLKSPVVDKYLAWSDKNVADWRSDPQGGDPRRGVPGLHLPSGCYNHMIHPIEKFAIRGVLFYQGENSAVNNGGPIDFAHAYPLTYPAVIRNWRQLFQDPRLPFCIIQMAPWGEPAELTHASVLDHPSPFVRDVHLQTFLKWPQTGLVVTMDCGKVGDMHPLNKEPVGQRAARWALAEVYGVAPARDWTGPIYRSMEIKGNKAVIRFHRDGLKLPLGLQNPAGRNDGFIIAGSDSVWQEAQAAIVGDTVEVWSDKVPEPAAVRYAWEDCQGLVNLIVNADGLPASPFRTDRWVARPIFDQPLLLPAEGARPWADAGPDQIVLTGPNPVRLEGGGHHAPDVDIVRYAWTRLGGPAGGTRGEETATLTLDDPAPGQHVFRLTVTDSRGNTASDDVTVMVIDGSLPVADAGKDQEVVWVWADGAVLDGSGSRDVFGSLASYAWTQVSGPNTATFADPDDVTASVSGLVAGTYVFRLTVTDNLGKQASDDVTVTVRANPIVNGGFETGDFTGWTSLGDPLPVVQSDQAHSGRFAALVGNNTGTESPNGNGWQGLHLGRLNMLENLPANARLSVWVRRSGRGTMSISLREGNGRGTGSIQNIMLGDVAPDSDWEHVTADLSAHAGKKVSLWFQINGGVDNQTFMLVDDVELLPGTPAE